MSYKQHLVTLNETLLDKNYQWAIGDEGGSEV